MVVIVDVLFDFVVNVLYIAHVLVKLALLLLAGRGLLAFGLFHFNFKALILLFVKFVQVLLCVRNLVATFVRFFIKPIKASEVIVRVTLLTT